MKKIIIFLLSILFLSCDTNDIKDTILEDCFYDVHTKFKQEDYRPWGIYSLCSNDDAGFVWKYEYIMEAYVLMGANPHVKIERRYEYLKTFIRIFSHILEYRDDKIPQEDYWGRILPWWSNSHKEYQSFQYGDATHTGRLLYPAAFFCEFILNPDTENSFKEYVYTPFIRDNKNEMFNKKTFHEIAISLLEEIHRSVRAHIDSNQWVIYNWDNIPCGSFEYQDPHAPNMIRNNNHGYDDNLRNHDIPYNGLAASGRTMISMYTAFNYIDDARKNEYREYAVRLTNRMFSKTSFHNDGGYIWWYEDKDYTDANDIGNYAEDTGHTFITMDFIYQSYKHHIPGDVTSSTPVFSENSMQRMAATVNRIYAGSPLNFYKYINGNTNSPISIYSGKKLCAKKIEILPLFIQFSQWDREIYHRCLDPLLDIILNYNNHTRFSGPIFLALAYATYYGKEYNFKFRPLCLSRGPGNGSYWRGAEGGDFDGDGRKQEYVAVRDGDKTFFIYKAEFDGSMRSLSTLNTSGWVNGTWSWADVSAGNITNGFRGDEIAAVRNYNGYTHFLVFYRSNSTLVQFASYTGYGNSSEWAGICVGNFDGQGTEEIAAIRNNDGYMTILEYNDGADKLVGLTGSDLTTNITNWVDLTAGDIDNDGRCEIIGVTGNGAVYLFYYKKSTVPVNSYINQVAVQSDYRIEGPVLSATLGDFNGDKKRDELILLDSRGNFTVLRLSCRNQAEDYEIWQSNFLLMEKMDETFFSRASALGVIDFPLYGTGDKLIVLRNSHSDGHMFIYNVNSAE